jgi:phosphopantothenoylcysteine decarboxylase/phosphopantothenate--cysteine ligase
VSGLDSIRGRHILLGVTGSIAAYKAVLLLRQLTRAGARVTVVMTASAQRFVAPLTFEGLSGEKAHTDLFAEGPVLRHLSLAEEADLILVAPATANLIGKMTNGVADDLLTTILLATRKPVVVAPAMDGEMWWNPALQKNLAILDGWGVRIVPPEEGPLASGKEAMGRLASEEKILAAVADGVGRSQDFDGETILITAGPTREPLDPIRFISNRSSGKMGYALAKAALLRGARVILVSGPASLPPPNRVESIGVETAEEMRRAVLKRLSEATVLIMAAAVGDFRPKVFQSRKIKKSDQPLNLELEPTPDILSEVAAHKTATGGRCVLVGFAAETGDPIPNAKAKLEQKALDLMVANDVTREGAGFESETNIVTLIDRTGRIEELPQLFKFQVADKILDRVKELIRQNPKSKIRNPKSN